MTLTDRYPVAASLGAEVHYVDSPDGLDGLRAWLAGLGSRALAFDTETTGLDHYAEGFALRLVQVADERTGYVLDLERGGPEVLEAVRETLQRAPMLVAHNAPYDLLALDAAGVLPLEALASLTFDTRTLAHLVDPRQAQDGGVGHGLKALAAHYLDAGAADGEARLAEVFRANGWRKADGFARIDSSDPVLVEYAGLDAVLTARLLPVLAAKVRAAGMGHLVDFERAVAYVLARMQRRGVLLDQDYAGRLWAHLVAEEATAVAECAALGLDNVNAPKQVAAALEALGAELTTRTASGQHKVDKAVLRDLEIAGGMPGELAATILRAKHAGKYRATYIDGPLEALGPDGRVHARLGALQARTARMSVSAPPLQQLPSGDGLIRRLFVADYDQIELRVLAALAGEQAMLEAIAGGVDLHTFAAELMGTDRRTAKAAGFGQVYGGGAGVLARTAGISLHDAKNAAAAYKRAFPGVQRWARKLQADAKHGELAVRTASGRRLPLDRSRLYAATNYVVQSTARDVLAEALLDLDEAGLEPYLLMPIHDEVLWQAPEAEAEEVARAIGEAMSTRFKDTVELTATGEVYGRSWGDGYDEVQI